MQNASIQKMADFGGGQAANPADAAGQASQAELIRRKVNQFATRNGRRPRVLVSHIGPSGQKRTLNQVAAVFARWGFDVDIGPIGQLPHRAALMAIENDVHMVCLLCDPDQQPQMEGEVTDALRSFNSDDILVAFFGGTHTDGNHGHVPSGQFARLGIRLASADSDILLILDKLFQANS
jgi:methylmalonyl-CoA mutase cobalamin-binding domain/chain